MMALMQGLRLMLMPLFLLYTLPLKLGLENARSIFPSLTNYIHQDDADRRKRYMADYDHYRRCPRPTG